MISQSFKVTLLLLALANTAYCHHPFDFFSEPYEWFKECLSQNNITYEEYAEFEAPANWENVEQKYKCNMDCRMQYHEWHDEEGRFDLELMNTTDEVGAAITKCMEDAPEEQCAYSFKLFMCANESNYLVQYHPVDLFYEEPDEWFDDCLTQNNITNEEYEEFKATENLENLISGNVEQKYKCNMHCQMQYFNWQDKKGRMDLQLMETTKEVGVAVTKCMKDAPKEQCAYSFQLVMCGYDVYFSEDDEVKSQRRR